MPLANEPLTVSDLTAAIKNVIEPSFADVYLQGEISNFKQHSSGHLYFSLKDAGAQIAAAMFYPQAAKLKSLPKEGDQVVVRGDVAVYAPRGAYQIVVRELQAVGIGALLLKLEELKKEIHRRGWFAKEHKKSLPTLPKRIGIVTSPTGAAIQDILKVLTRRFFGLHIILNPVRVQGEGAAEEIAKAIDEFNRYQLADVLIVGRGGGSIEDLFAFNEECVAKAIFESEIPIICAVGHETDHCIAEYVADVRAPTPSAAAEMVIAEKAQLVTHLLQLQSRLLQGAYHQMYSRRQQLKFFEKQPVLTKPLKLIEPWVQQLDLAKEGIDRQIEKKFEHLHMKLSFLQKQAEGLRPLNQIRQYHLRLMALSGSLNATMRHQFERFQKKIEFLKTTLTAIDPKNLLTRGYSILFAEKGGSIIKSVSSLYKGQTVKMLLSDGEATATIKEPLV